MDFDEDGLHWVGNIPEHDIAFSGTHLVSSVRSGGKFIKRVVQRVNVKPFTRYRVFVGVVAPTL